MLQAATMAVFLYLSESIAYSSLFRQTNLCPPTRIPLNPNYRKQVRLFYGHVGSCERTEKPSIWVGAFRISKPPKNWFRWCINTCVKVLNQYAPMQGILPLRERIAEKAEALYGARYNPDTEITITSGGTQAIYTAITAMIREGDEVVVLEPAYDSYVPAIELAGGVPVYVALKFPDYSIDWNAVKRWLHSVPKWSSLTPAQSCRNCMDTEGHERAWENNFSFWNHCGEWWGVWTHPLRRLAAWKWCAIRNLRKEALWFFFRKNIPHHRMENGILSGSRKTDDRVSQSASVCCV